MINALYPPARPQSVGEVLDLAFRIFGATLLKCLPFAALAVIAGQLPNAYTLSSGQPLLTNPQVGSSAFTQNNAKHLLGPRAALAWDVFGNGRTAVRAGFGPRLQ